MVKITAIQGLCPAAGLYVKENGTMFFGLKQYYAVNR